MSVFLYCFREREMILDVFEEISGVRMMTSYICPGGLQADITPVFDEEGARVYQRLPRPLAGIS